MFGKNRSRCNSIRNRRRVGQVAGLPKQGGYNKSLLRVYHRKLQNTPATPTGKTVKSANGKMEYRVWTDGSYRAVRQVGVRKLIAV